MDKAEIYEWLKSQKYQTGYDEVGEYVMYYSVDMPRILEDYYEYKVKKLNIPDVSNCLRVMNAAKKLQQPPVIKSVCDCPEKDDCAGYGAVGERACNACQKNKQTVL